MRLSFGSLGFKRRISNPVGAGIPARQGSSTVETSMRSLQLFGDRDLRLTDMDPPPPPGPGEVQVRIKALALNYLDVWGFRGMAFAKRKMPQIAGVEAAGEVVAVGPGVTRFEAGDPVTMYGADTCGTCKACREGRDNLCENVAGIMGFHIDGFARELVNRPERLVIPVPDAGRRERRHRDIPGRQQALYGIISDLPAKNSAWMQSRRRGPLTPEPNGANSESAMRGNAARHPAARRLHADDSRTRNDAAA